MRKKTQICTCKARARMNGTTDVLIMYPNRINASKGGTRRVQRLRHSKEHTRNKYEERKKKKKEETISKVHIIIKIKRKREKTTEENTRQNALTNFLLRVPHYALVFAVAAVSPPANSLEWCRTHTVYTLFRNSCLCEWNSFHFFLFGGTKLCNSGKWHSWNGLFLLAAEWKKNERKKKNFYF